MHRLPPTIVDKTIAQRDSSRPDAPGPRPAAATKTACDIRPSVASSSVP